MVFPIFAKNVPNGIVKYPEKTNVFERGSWGTPGDTRRYYVTKFFLTHAWMLTKIEPVSLIETEPDFAH